MLSLCGAPTRNLTTLWARAEISAFASFVGSVSQKDFSAAEILQINSKLRLLKDSSSVTLKFPKLDPNTLRILVYTDTYFANRNDRSI